MGESMAKYTKEAARGIIFAGAAKYKEKLSDREAAWELTYCDKDFNAEAYLQDMQHGKNFS